MGIRRLRVLTSLVALGAVGALTVLSSCTPSRGNAVPLELTDRAKVPGLESCRFWSDEHTQPGFEKMWAASIEKERALLNGAPLDPPADGKAPLVLYIHGGPQGFDGDFFDFDLENQLFPAAGWGVLRVNYRGSTSYGEKFSRALWGDWHSREFEDLMAALDGAIATHPWIDADRLGVGGWSYGGIMSLWSVGHTDRFKVAVPERLSFDYLSTFGEDQWSIWYLSELGSPIENAELYRRLSPGTYVANIRTPLYLIANEDDFNCPLPQILQLYQRLLLLGQKPELVVYPDESHSMSVPSHYADRLRRLLVWFGRHLDS